MARTTFHTTEELDAWAAECLRYEFTQLAANALLQVVDGLVLTPLRSASWVNNAVLKSFLLHARAWVRAHRCGRPARMPLARSASRRRHAACQERGAYETSKVLGHASASFTASVYQHADEESFERTRGAIEDASGGP